MSETFLDRQRVSTLSDQESDRGVSQVVEADARILAGFAMAFEACWTNPTPG